MKGSVDLFVVSFGEYKEHITIAAAKYCGPTMARAVLCPIMAGHFKRCCTIHFSRRSSKTLYSIKKLTLWKSAGKLDRITLMHFIHTLFAKML